MASESRSGSSGKRNAVNSRKSTKARRMQAISFKLRKEEAIIFQAYAKSQGKTVRGLLVEFIRACNKSFPGAEAVLQDPSAEQMSFDDFGEDGNPDAENSTVS